MPRIRFSEPARHTSSRDKSRKRPENPRSPESRKRARHERAAERAANPDLAGRAERALMHPGRN